MGLRNLSDAEELANFFYLMPVVLFAKTFENILARSQVAECKIGDDFNFSRYNKLLKAIHSVLSEERLSGIKLVNMQTWQMRQVSYKFACLLLSLILSNGKQD